MEILKVIWMMLSLLGWFLILFYYIPYSVTKAIRKAKRDVPLDALTVVNLNLKQ